MHRLLIILSAGISAATFMLGLLVSGASPAAAATIAATTTCSNGVDNTGGLGLICEVTVNNTITPSGGSASVTVRECHGAAGDPAALCTITTNILSSPVTGVTQCNGSTNGGGASMRCTVDIVNTYVGISATATAVTVNQCVGSGDGFTVGCVPFPATITGATITQSNGSANGGTLVGLFSTATGTETSAQLVTINQCNGSTNGGGGLLICSSSMSNINQVVATATPAPTALPAPVATAVPTAVPGAVATAAPTAAPTAPGAAVPGPSAPGLPVFSVPEINSLFPGLPTIPNTAFAAAKAALMAGLSLLTTLGFLVVVGGFFFAAIKMRAS
ncbi:MAG: hypothetical protein M3R32_07390 [Chloroflexota bacterium]|nr:hypothetical protein [Chloroflexota bacterium]